MRFRHILFIVIIFAMTGSSCKQRGGKYIDQGEIHYNIDYKGNFGILKEALPQNLVVAFKDDKILFEMVGLGNSGILNLSNPDKDIYDTYFSFFVTKYYYAAEKDEIFPGFESMKGMIVRKTTKTTVICGYNCKNAEITLPGIDTVFDIWYTDEIQVRNPNASTPFNQIDGVLMSFFFIMGNAEMHFMAETVYEKEIPDEHFERRDNYTRVTKDSIREFMNKILSI